MSSRRIRITSFDRLLQLAQRVEADGTFSTTIKQAHIALDCRDTFRPSAVRRFLACAWHITDLTLHLPQDTPSIVFDGVILPFLYSFDTNLPHGELTGLIGSHLSITELYLRDSRCAADRCPLIGLNLDGVALLSCPFACMPSIVGREVHTLELSLEGCSLLPSDIFSLAPSRPKIEHLVTDIASGDELFLSGLSSFAPNVKHLKIIEFLPLATVAQSFETQESTEPIWLRFDLWYNGLQSLVYLETIALKTYGPLVATPGNRLEEKRLVGRWASNTHTLLEGGHSTLCGIGLWYGGDMHAIGERSEGTLSRWVKSDIGVFKRTRSRLRCPHTDLFRS